MSAPGADTAKVMIVFAPSFPAKVTRQVPGGSTSEDPAAAGSEPSADCWPNASAQKTRRISA
jgi:hypothetical protein